MKTYYPCAIVPEDEGNFSVYFPDIKNCVTCGDTLEESLEMAEDVLATMLQELAEDRKEIPTPSRIEAIVSVVKSMRDEADLPLPNQTIYQYIPAPNLDMVPVRVTVSFTRSTLSHIDQKATQYGFTRSGFLAHAASAYNR